jgi:hypothetical protein
MATLASRWVMESCLLVTVTFSGPVMVIDSIDRICSELVHRILGTVRKKRKQYGVANAPYLADFDAERVATCYKRAKLKRRCIKVPTPARLWGASYES